MVKFLKVCGVFLLTFTCIAVSLVLYGQKSIPDEIILQDGTALNMSPIFTLSQNGSERSLDESLSYSVDVSLLNIIPVKTSTVYVSKRHYVIPGGDIFGLKLYSSGVMIIDTAYVETAEGQINPAENAGLKKGDLLTQIDGVKVRSSDEAANLFQNCEGRELVLNIIRHGEEMTLSFTPAISSSDGKYKAGLWIRDSAAGIGTVTFIDPSTGLYGALGHAVCDSDTEEIIPIENGEAVSAMITGCYKGSKGKAGELCGVFGTGHIGTILINSSSGVYGKADDVKFPYELMAVASRSEVKTGKAQIISTVSGNDKKYYDIEITKINGDDENGRNLSIKVTDKELIEATGGIVQGMSGSPIIQNGMLVGAVTHVFVNDSQKGYAIYAESMLEISDELSKNTVLDSAA